MRRITGLKYLVERANRHWTVSFQGDQCGRFANRRAAMRSAVSDARRVRSEGHEVDVLVERKTGSFRALPDRLLAPREQNLIAR